MKLGKLLTIIQRLTLYACLLISLNPLSGETACIKTALNMKCEQDTDCHVEGEGHLYCNRSGDLNKCAYDTLADSRLVNELVYVGRVLEDWDCPSDEYSAYPGSSPVGSGVSSGLDCMRLCYESPTCFGAAVKEGKCYLKNDECFHSGSLEASPGTLLGVVRVFRDDYRCGCQYQFERIRRNGTVVKWNPPCPGSHLETSRYKCCSKKGMCERCA